MRKAVIDVGSNSVLLVVEELEGGGWKQVLETSRVTGLGADTRRTGILGDAGMAKTLAGLAAAFEEARSGGCDQVVAAVTMAGRIAKNTPAFLEAAQRQGTPVIVLSGEDEARLGFECVALDPCFNEFSTLTVIDVGGQSTELVTGSRGPDGSWDIAFGRSFSMGSLALTGGTLREECPDPTAILTAVVEIDDVIGLCYRRGACGQAVALGATATNLAAIRDKVVPWDPTLVHGKWLNYSEVSMAAGELFRMTELDRAKLPGMEPGREASLPAGALILERFLNATGAPGCSVSVRGWRHALLETS